MEACHTIEKVAVLQEKEPGINVSRIFPLVKSKTITYTNVDLVPLMRIHLEVSVPLLSIVEQRCPQERIRLDCETDVCDRRSSWFLRDT